MPAQPLPDDLINKTRKPSTQPITLPRGREWARQDPSAYVPSPGLVAAVEVALLLRKPLLLTGEPGTGKTEFGKYLAWKIGATAHQFDCKSDSKAQDLFYNYDPIERFSPDKSDTHPSRYFSFRGLGRAIVRSHPFAQLPENIQLLLQPFEGELHPKGEQSVVIVDEIDKAPRDFPNDLLNEFTRGDFSIPPLGIFNVRENPDLKPVLIITSNSERNLPAPFLRRCVYHHIEFPDKLDDLREIVSGRIAEIPKRQSLDEPAPPLPALLLSLLQGFLDLRNSGTLSRRPATAELIDWIIAWIDRGADLSKPASMQPLMIEATLSSLIKDKDQYAAALAFLNQKLKDGLRNSQ